MVTATKSGRIPFKQSRRGSGRKKVAKECGASPPSCEAVEARAGKKRPRGSSGGADRAEGVVPEGGAMAPGLRQSAQRVEKRKAILRFLRRQLLNEGRGESCRATETRSVEAAASLERLIRATVEHGTNNSVLLVGAPGSGKKYVRSVRPTCSAASAATSHPHHG